ncbi:MAG: polysaccharide biosynthesis tyrosine autokinase [Phycisphaerales bacterium]
MTPLDPVKLLKKYVWWLAAAAVVGAVIGTVAHFALLKLAPKYVSEVVFEIGPAQVEPGQLFNDYGRADEFERFMATQQQRMISSSVLEKVAQDPRLPMEAPNWIKPYMKGGAVNYIEASRDLADIVKARIVTGTSYIILSAAWKNPVDATAIAKLVKETYLSELSRTVSVEAQERAQLINSTIQSIEEQIRSANDQRARLLREQSVDSLDDRASALGQQQTLVLNQLAEVNQAITQLTSMIEQMEKMRNSETGITYSDTQRAAANQDPIVLNLRQQLKAVETELQQLRQQGFKEAHREYRRLQARADSITQQIQESLNEALARNFDAEYDQLTRDLRTYQARNLQLTQEAEKLRTQLAELNENIAKIDDLDRQVNELIAAKQTQSENLANLRQQADRKNAGRVSVIQSERKPTEVSFPKIIIMVPAGVVIVTGLVGGVVVLRELFDQRVKGPSDITLLPRAKVLGMIPSREEDPSTNAPAETVFRDVPSSVLAEHIRQLRTAVIQQMQRQGHKSLVVLGGMPGSGASTVVANLGMACASTDLRVLIVDGNFRRPAQHRIFKTPDSPGLADQLAGLASVDDVIVHVPGEAKLDLVPVGSAEHRVFERLGAHQMGMFLDAVKDRYDLIIVDVAPALVSSDGLALANRVDASMLVVRALGETRGMVARLRNELDECRADMLGVLVNAVRSAAGGYMRQNIRVSQAYHTPGVKVGASIDHPAPKS